MNRISTIHHLLLAVFLFNLDIAHAQQSTRIPRIAYVSGTGNANDQGPFVEALRHGLRDLRHVEGRTYILEYRGAEGKLDRVSSIIKELSELKVDVLIAPFSGAVRAAKQATSTIPIVFVTGADPIANGWVASLARPGGNITGVYTLAQDLNGKRLELMTEIVPRLSRLAILWAPGEGTAPANYYKEYEAASRVLKVQLQSLEVDRDEPDVERAFQAAAAARTGGVITITSSGLFLKQKLIAALALKNRLPTMFQGSTWVEAGGLISYATDDFDALRRAAAYVDKILKGAKPADLPVEQSAKYEMVVNLKTAKQIGLRIPPIVMARADRVIR